MSVLSGEITWSGMHPYLGHGRVKDHEAPGRSSPSERCCAVEMKKVMVKKEVSRIRNRCKRREVHAKVKAEKKKVKKSERTKRQREVLELGDEAPPKQVPRTLENTREVDETIVQPDDLEVVADEAEDEFQPYFSGKETPKILITTRPRPSRELFHFVGDLMQVIPNAFFYPRKSFEVKAICKHAEEGGFTHVFILSEKYKACNGLLVSHLPCGPTVFFKVSNVTPGAKIAHHGQPTAHVPELILNNFNTRLGHRVGRFLGSFFPHAPEFRGRQVVTFHNQRDFLFVRHHRYVFDEKKAKSVPEINNPKKIKSAGDGSKAIAAGGIRARLQELGPRFTLKLRWLQEGTFDTKFGEYEWLHKRKEMDTTRRRFHL